MARPMAQPSSTPNTPPARPITPASAKNNLRTSRSEAPSALRTPISRRRSRMAITSVLMIPSEATASARLPKIPRNISKMAKNVRRLRVTSISENAAKPMCDTLVSICATAAGLVARVALLHHLQFFRDGERQINSRIIETDLPAGFGSGSNADNCKFFLARHDREAHGFFVRPHRLVRSVGRSLLRRRRQRLALRESQRNLLADQRIRGLSSVHESLAQISLDNGFFGVRVGKEVPGQSVQRPAVLRRRRHAGHHHQLADRIVARFGREPHFRIYFHNIRQRGDLFSRGIIQRARRLELLPVARVAPPATGLAEWSALPGAH